ncbi:hypothetical protein CsSME_00001601 [Camellia sinensis var. sinensis]
MFLLGTTLFANQANTVPLCLLSALVDVTQIRFYDWGSAGLATLYDYMSSSSRLSRQLLKGSWQAWELWVYAYFPRLAPLPDEETPLGVPFSHCFDVRCVRRPRESFIFFRRYFDTITAAEPWALLPAAVRERYEGAQETTRFRILLEGPRYTLREMATYTIGGGAKGFRGEGDYTEYVQTYIMRPLSSGRRAERERPAAPTARAGAGAGAPRMARARGRSGPWRGQGVGWLALPTMMTYRGQSGEMCQIPFAPPPADHELVNFYDLPPASSEYTRQSLELNASMMGMLQRSFDLLAIYSIPPPFQMSAAGGAPAGPSVPARGGGRGGIVHLRTEARRTHVGSSSRAPVPDDDESGAEAESPEEETGDGSGSDDGADDDAPGPSSRKRTRIDP